MNVPAYASPNLRIGRSYDAQTSKAGIDIYTPGNIDIEDTKVNQFNFEYRVIKNSKDTKDLLNISGELSLKIKAGLVLVSGAGKYLSDNKRAEDTTEVLAVLKCLTVCFTTGLVMIIPMLRASCVLKHNEKKSVVSGSILVKLRLGKGERVCLKKEK